MRHADFLSEPKSSQFWETKWKGKDPINYTAALNFTRSRTHYKSTARKVNHKTRVSENLFKVRPFKSGECVIDWTLCYVSWQPTITIKIIYVSRLCKRIHTFFSFQPVSDGLFEPPCRRCSPEGPPSVCALILCCLFVLGVCSLHLHLSLCPVHPVSIWLLYNWLFFGRPACLPFGVDSWRL